MRAGVILAPTIPIGEKFKNDLGLKYWYVTTPDMLLDGRTRRVSCEPRIIAVNVPGHDLMSDTILVFSNYLVNLCGGVTPKVFHIREAGS